MSLFAEIVRLFGVLIITVNLRSAGGGSKATNISLMSQKLYLVVFGTRLVFKLFYEDFDFIYVLVESSALAATGKVPACHPPPPLNPNPHGSCCGKCISCESVNHDLTLHQRT